MKQSFEECKKRKSLENELSDLKAKRKRLAMDAKVLEDSADDPSVKAEKRLFLCQTLIFSIVIRIEYFIVEMCNESTKFLLLFKGTPLGYYYNGGV